MRSLLFVVTAALVLVLPARGGESPSPDRTEWAALPSIGNTPDFGFMLGGVFIATRYEPHSSPYSWMQVFVAVTSFKEGPEGTTEQPLRNFLYALDRPDVLGSRLGVTVQNLKVINASWYGLGNASSDEVPPGYTGEPGRYHQFIHRSSGAAASLRRPLVSAAGFEVQYGLRLTLAEPAAYDQSRLSEDIDDVSGLGETTIAGITFGLLKDTRDHENFPSKGWMRQLAAGFATGFGAEETFFYGGMTITHRSFAPLGESGYVLAHRAVADLLAGDVPFFGLGGTGAFIPTGVDTQIGGIRGVPDGRFAGKIKALGSVELRSPLSRPVVRGDAEFRGRWIAFADAGRVWADYGRDSVLDGRGLGLRWGAGAGLHLRWGEPVLFRCELAYSPWAEGGPGVGLYLLFNAAF